ncbi:MAG: exosortase U [Planctomycetota bacterium]|nr:exosortase U [Planctomycetota bacterium]
MKSYLIRLDRWDWYAIVLPMIALAPLLFFQAIYLWSREHMQFFPLAICASCSFFYWEGQSKALLSLDRVRLSWVLSGMATLLCLIALVLYSPWMAHVASVLLCVSWALGRFGNLTPLRIFGICGLLAVTIPLPLEMDRTLVQVLQGLSANISSRLMDLTGILHFQKGNIIEIAAKPLFVEEACSGVDSQYALMAVAGILLLIGRAGLVVSSITIVTVPLWAILGNLLRIYSIVFGLEFLNVDLTSGAIHTILGFITFSLAAFAHWSSVQLLNYFDYLWWNFDLNATGRSDNQPDWVVGVISKTSSMAVFKGHFAIPFVLLLFFPFGIVGLLEFSLRSVNPPFFSSQLSNIFPKEGDVPSKLSGSERIGFLTETRVSNNNLGQYSRIWQYSRENADHLASLDFPFRGWHSLWRCYQTTGWKEQQRIRVETSADDEPIQWPFYESRLQNMSGEHAILHFSLFDGNGAPYDSESAMEKNDAQSRISKDLISALVRQIRSLKNPIEPVTFQFQLLTRSDSPIPTEQIMGYRQMFLTLRKMVHNKSLPALEVVRRETLGL